MKIIIKTNYNLKKIIQDKEIVHFVKNLIINKLKLKVEQIFKINVILLSKTDFYLKLQQNNIECMAFVEGDAIYISSKIIDIPKVDAVQLIKHELVHLIFCQLGYISERWIMEGCAAFFSGQFIDFKEIKGDMCNIKIIKDLEKDFTYTYYDYLFSCIYIKYIYENYRDIFMKLIQGNIDVYEIEIEAINYLSKTLD